MGFFGLFGGKKNKTTTISKPPYTGPRPFEAGAVGYGADKLKTLADAYLPALMSRASGESGVGFDPQRREILRSEFLKDFGDYSSDIYSKASQQASGQGLRGGIPLEIQADNTKSLARARESGLAGIDVEDLAARREDTNKAFYQQPEEVSRGAGIQQNAANFGLNEYNATLPDTIIDEPSQSGPSFLQSAADLGTSYVASGGNPYATLAMVLMKRLNQQQGGNKSFAQNLQPWGM